MTEFPKNTSPEVGLLGVPNTYLPGMTGGLWMCRELVGFQLFILQELLVKLSPGFHLEEHPI